MVTKDQFARIARNAQEIRKRENISLGQAMKKAWAKTDHVDKTDKKKRVGFKFKKGY